MSVIKILVVCQHYFPEPMRITDICEELVKMGHEVDIITDVPNYPMGKIYNGYSLFKNKDIQRNGVNIKRCFTIPRKKGTIMRVLNYYSFSISSSIYARKIKKDYDVVFVNQLSPVMMANAGIKYKQKRNKKLVLYCLDLWPESLLIGGIKKNSIAYKFFHMVSKKIYQKSDRILISSRFFKDYMQKEFNIDDSKIELLPQYAESIFTPETCKKIPDDKVNIVFAGNVGKAQSIDTIVNTAEKLKNVENLYFHIVGDGVKYQFLKDKINELNLDNVKVYGRKDISEMPAFYKMADAMLVTLSGGSFVSETLPGKVQTYMAAGKPIIGAANGETKIVIEEAKCGFCGSADNADELAENILEFINYENKEELGMNSYKYYEQNYSKEKFLNKLVEELERIREEK